MEDGDVFAAQYDPAANGGQGGWVALGNSLSSGGISGTGAADHPILVTTASGPAVAWLNESGGVTEIRVQQFNGATWAAVGSTVVASAGDLSELTFATDGTKLAVGWSQTDAGVRHVYALEFAGSSWMELAGSASGSGISTDSLPAAQPTLVYHDGALYAAWQQHVRAESNETEIFAARFDGAAWSAAGASAMSGGGVSDTGGTASQPRLVSNGGALHLAWTEELLSSAVGTGTTIYDTHWDGSDFVEAFVQSGDIGSGITGSGDGLLTFSLAVNAAGQPFVTWSNSESGSPQVYVRGDTLAVNRVLYTSSDISLQDVLDSNTMVPGDIVVITLGTSTASAVLTAADSGIIILGTNVESSRIEGLITLDGADDVTISNVTLAGGLVATSTDALHVTSSRIGGVGLSLDSTTGTRVINNGIDSDVVGLTIQSNDSAVIEFNSIFGVMGGVLVAATDTGTEIAHNVISSGGTGLNLAADLVGGVVLDNDIQNSTLGVNYAAAAELRDNRIRNNTVGIQVAASQVADGLGYVGTRGTNQIYANVTGVELFGRMRDQTIRDNTTGITGSGVLGPISLDEANLIYHNATGANFGGTIQFNQFIDNTIGIQAQSDSQFTHNVIAGNGTAGILVSGVTDVQIANNTLYATTGDNVRLENQAKEVEVRGNILWAEAGTDIFVSDNSRGGFFSDYNQLHATGSGTLVHWIHDFADILDWQVDVNVFDLHSIGTTVVNPLGAEPAFVSVARDDFQLWNLTAGLRRTNPSVDGADPRMDVGVPLSFDNLLTNPSFEAGVSGWTTNVQGTAGTPDSAPFDGAAFFVPGAVATGVAEQTIDLTAAGFTPAQLDSQNLVAVFGGRVRSKAENPIDTATITFEFRDGGGSIISSQARAAANVGDRWDLVGDRLAVPVGARQVTFRFESIRMTGTTNDAHLDNAFVYLLSEAIAPDYGAFGHSDEELPSAGPHIALRYPDLYIDWQRDVAKTIRWQSYDNSANAPVRIDLLQDGPHGPEFVTTIAASTPDDSEFIWIPGNSGVNFDTPGLRIQVSLVGVPFAFDRAQEPFTVPDNSLTFFVDDSSNTDDEYTPTAVGSNRNTGKTATAPKPNPVNLLRAYNLPAGAIVSIDTGSYPLFDPIRISGSVDLGLGLEEAFTLRGPTDTNKDVTISWIYPDGFPQALIELSDADFMTLSNLDLIGSQRGLWVTGGSDNFAASFITARNQTLDGIDITPNNPAAQFVGLVAENAGRHGIVITGEFTSLSDGHATGNADRGILLSGSGDARVEAMEVSGNRIGIDVTNFVTGTETVIGNNDLSLGRGNLIHDNVGGVVANNRVLVAGNTVYGHTASIFNPAIQTSGTGVEVARNVVFGNQKGITVTSGAAVHENRVYGNLITGITADFGSPILSNVVYNNPTGILVTASTALIANNLIYNNSTGLKLSQGNGADIINNTVYQVAAGNGIRIESNAQNIELRNNIIWAADGVGLSVSNDSQVGLASDFNLLRATGTGVVGSWLGANQTTLQQWQIATGRDANSLSNDPLFVDADGADDMLGYVAGISDGSDDDFHVQSTAGSFHGGSLAPVRDGTSGLPVFPAITQTVDPSLSPAIDRGAESDSFANEPSPNGGFINIGAYGNTAQASLSQLPLLLLLDPNGGEIVPQGSTLPIRWRADGFTGNVLLEVSSSGPAGPFDVLAAGEPNDGEFDWVVDAGTFPASADYFLRITSEDQPSVIDVSDASFEVAVPTNAYYVNIAGDVDFADNEYTTAVGNAANTGLSPASPMASIQAVLNAYDLEPGDVIYVDTGSYSVTTNIVIGAADSGVRVQGPVLSGHLASLNRNNTAAGSYVFQLQDATDVTLDSLEIFGANEGVLVDLASDDFTITNSIVRNNSSRGIHVKDTATRAVIADDEIFGQNASFTAAVEINGDDAVVRNNVIHDNTSATGISVTSTAANTLIRENDIFANGGAIITSQPSNVPSGLVIEDNTVHGNAALYVVNIQGPGLVQNNDIYGNTSSTIALALTGEFADARDNLVHGNLQGMRVDNGAVASGNRVFDNSTIGIEVSAAKALGNVIYGNATGIRAGASGNQISNNVIYANTSFGLDQSNNASGTVVNNTFFQPVGDAIRESSAGTTLVATNNIFVIGSGSAFNIADSSQLGFSSDYNLFQVIGGGSVATWGSTTLSSWQDWQFATGNDRHGLETDPLLVDPDGTDDVLGNEDDDFHLLPGSPALNAGDPLALYAGEPASGNVADLGAYGNDAGALASGVQRIQLTEPGTYQKVEVGQPVDIQWISSGLTDPAPVLQMNAGGTGVYDAATGRWSADAFRRGPSQMGTAITQPIDTSAVTDPPPTSVLQSYAQTNGNVGSFSRYEIPLADGDYQIRLFFVDPTSSVVNQRKFDVTLQGQTVLTNYDIFADAGAVRKAVVKTFSFTASEGNGLQLDLTNRSSGFNGNAIINAFEITRNDVAAPAAFTVDLEFSPDNGQNWTTIATNLTPNRFGGGEFTWTADEATQGHTGLFRATAVGNGLSGVTGISPQAVSVSNSTNTYYVNVAGDTDFTDNEYTTAAGNDLNSGTLPDAPLASLSVLLANYDLGPGDTVFVDSGTYNLTQNIEITSIQSGVRIHGPTVGTHAAVLNRGNTSTGNYVIQLIDATDVTLDSLELTGGFTGLQIDGASHDAMLSSSVVRNNFIGVDVLSTADRAVLVQNDIFANTSTAIVQAAVVVAGDDALIDANSIHDNAGQAIYIDNPAANVTVRGNDMFGNPLGGVFLTGTSGLIEQNTIHANASNLFSQGGIYVASASSVVQDNVIFGNGKPGISIASTGAAALRNIVYDNTDGILVGGSSAIIGDNRIYHNSQAGVRITSSGATVSGNSIYANSTGVIVAFSFGAETSTITNNEIYDHASAGVEVNVTASAGQGAVNIHNNTIYEPADTAIHLIAGSKSDVRNNILVTDSGLLFNIASGGQAGVTSDYNLLQVTGGGSVGVWGAASVSSRSDWYFELGLDQHSLEGDPQFVDIDGQDNHLGYDTGSSTDFGADDNFSVSSTSPAISAGDPLSYYSTEPVSGNRVNLGAFGNTADATPSSPQRIQLVEPAGLAKFETGQPITLDWVSAGFTASAPVALINAGGTGVFDATNGRWSSEAFRTGGSTSTVSGTIDTSLLASPPPSSVLQTYSQSPISQNGGSIQYDVPLPDGNYNIRLLFVEPTANGPNQRKFDIVLQGQTVLANYDIFADTGGVRKATAKSFTFTATQGAGLQLELINRLSSNAALVSGIEVTSVNPSAPATLAANLEFSPDDGASWTTIATDVPMGRFGDGTFMWNATTETAGHTGRFRITAVSDGVPTNVQSESAQPFSIANAGTAYYVNVASDGDMANNEYTTASGDNLNDGKSPSTPMRSLAGLVRAYDLDAGDTVFVDTGSYETLTNIVFGPEDSGVTIQGPTAAGHAATLTRNNTAAGNYVFEFSGGVSGVTIDSLEILGAEDGVHVTDATNVEIRDSIIRNNANRGIYIETTASDVRILNDQIQENTNAGVEVRGTGTVVADSLIRNSVRGVYWSSLGVANTTIQDNDIFGHNIGIDLFITGTGNLIQGNTIHDNASQGINAFAGTGSTLEILDNEVYGQSGTGDIGIKVGAGGLNAIAQGNRVHHNDVGIEATNSLIQHNQVYANTSSGIKVVGGNSDVRDNQIYSNATGLLVIDPSPAQFRNNMIYSNTNIGVDITTGTHKVINNTIYQPVGTAVRYTGSGTGTFKNNIVQGDVGMLVSVAAAGQAGFVSDYNLLYPSTPAANVGLWGTTTAPTLADWQSLTSRDAHSVSADPLFIDIDGADNVLGEQGLPEGNGADDNFYLRHGSPAIDAADNWVAGMTDHEGSERRDDDGTPNVGGPTYVESSLGASQFVAGGTAKNWRGNDLIFTLNFPGGFSFPFYGSNYSSVFVSTNGLLQFGVSNFASDGTNTAAEFLTQRRIAPLWDDLTTLGVGDDVFVDTSISDRVTIRWDATNVADGGDVQFSVTLVDTGEIQFHYGPGAASLTPTVGISAGDGLNFDLAPYDGQANLASVDSLHWTIEPGFTDIGAYEFRGSSLDVTPPTVVSTNPVVDDRVEEIELVFSEEINPIDATAPANYELRDDGGNGMFDDADDTIYTIVPHYTIGSNTVTLIIEGGADPNRMLRLTVSGNTSIHDSAGLKLDGDNNGTEGGNFVGNPVNNVPALPGDYNGNGVVDAADYTLYRGTLGQSVMPFSGADGNGNGVIDTGDYNVWRANFGNTLPLDGSVAVLTSENENERTREESPAPLIVSVVTTIPETVLPAQGAAAILPPSVVSSYLPVSETVRHSRPRLASQPADIHSPVQHAFLEFAEAWRPHRLNRAPVTLYATHPARSEALTVELLELSQNLDRSQIAAAADSVLEHYEVDTGDANRDAVFAELGYGLLNAPTVLRAQVKSSIGTWTSRK